MVDSKVTVSDFLEAVAARRPTPGGGAVAGVAGALAAAIGEMAVSYSIGKKGLEAHEPELLQILRRLSAARELLLQLVIEDQLAFEASQALKKQNAGEDALVAATLTAIRVPQAIAATAGAILDEAGRAAPVSNRWLLSDLAVCAELSMSAVRCAIYNVRINLGDVKDPADRASLESWCESVRAKCVARIQQVMPLIWSRVQNG